MGNIHVKYFKFGPVATEKLCINILIAVPYEPQKDNLDLRYLSIEIVSLD